MFGLFGNQNYESISMADFAALNHDKIRILDVREGHEYQGGHIAQATNWPLSQIETYQAAKDEKIYVICASGMRSKQASKVLDAKGYDIVNVQGGMMAWNGPVRKGK